MFITSVFQSDKDQIPNFYPKFHGARLRKDRKGVGSSTQLKLNHHDDLNLNCCMLHTVQPSPARCEFKI